MNDSENLCRRGSVLKFIIAIIQPARLDDVKTALADVEVVRLTVVDCEGFGRTRGHAPGPIAGRTMQLLRKIQLQIAVNDAFVEPTIDAIRRAALTRSTPGRSEPAGPGQGPSEVDVDDSADDRPIEGEPGDGKIFVLPMDDCVRVRTGERGEEAI